MIMSKFPKADFEKVKVRRGTKKMRGKLLPLDPRGESTRF